MKNKILLLLLFVSLIYFAKAQGSGEWTWMKGSNLPNSPGNYGVMGVSSPFNNPPSLYEAFEWTDLNGNFWLFGGIGSGNPENALWKFDLITNQWTWINGSNVSGASGIYGVQGIPSLNNFPGGRSFGGVTWIDSFGDLWLFGGFGYDAFGSSGVLNDLWRYNIASNMWTWMKGSNSTTTSSITISGIKGVANPFNTPNGRQESNAGVADNLGNLWLFGGCDDNLNAYNDLWKYNIMSNMWTWVAGNQNQNNTPNYGVINVSSPLNDPGDRNCYTKFIDSQNNLYFLGSSIDAWGWGQTNDVWRYNTTSSEWTWVGGTNLLNDTVGSYINECDTNILNLPQAKLEIRSSWSDSCGFFFFGGFNNKPPRGHSCYNDLWYYSLDNNKFVWISGSNLVNDSGNYGVSGISNTSNFPPARSGAVSFKDKQSNLWLFGGLRVDAMGNNVFNDLWRFKLDTSCLKLCSKSSFFQSSSTDTIVFPSENLFIPNVFTPNGDSSNNLFAIKAINYKSYNIIIYDRWGLKMFESSNANSHWNGKTNNSGAECPEGIYFYVLHLIDKNDDASDYKGFVSLFR